MMRSPAGAGAVLALCAALLPCAQAAGGAPMVAAIGQPDVSRELSEAQRLIEQKDWRGAHEYIGEAYLLSHQPDKARLHLAQLKDICGERCEEYQDLAKAVATYQTPAAPAK